MSTVPLHFISRHTNRCADANTEVLFGSALRLAAEHGQFAIVKRLLELGARTDGDRGNFALTAAATGGHEDIAELLIDSGAPLINTSTPLMNAVQRGHLGVVRLMLAKGAEVHALNYRALVVSCEQGRTDTVKALLDAYPNFGYMVPFLKSPLKGDHADVLNVSLRHQATRSVFVRQRNNLFVAAAKKSAVNCMKLLLSTCGYNHANDVQALVAAVARCKSEVVVKMFLELVPWERVMREQVLVTAARNNRASMVTLLYQYDQEQSLANPQSIRRVGDLAALALVAAVKGDKIAMVAQLMRLYYPNDLSASDLHVVLQCVVDVDNAALAGMCLDLLSKVIYPNPTASSFQALNEDIFVQAVRINAPNIVAHLILHREVSVNCRDGEAIRLAHECHMFRILAYFRQAGMRDT